MPDAVSISIRDYLRIDILGKEFEDIRRGDDANWLVVDVSGGDQASRFRYRGPYMQTNELRMLLKQLEAMLNKSDGIAKLETLEPCLELAFRWHDRLGHVRLELGVNLLKESSGVETSTHRYEIEIDQSDLQVMCKDLRAALKAYPVR